MKREIQTHTNFIRDLIKRADEKMDDKNSDLVIPELTEDFFKRARKVNLMARKKLREQQLNDSV